MIARSPMNHVQHDRPLSIPPSAVSNMFSHQYFDISNILPLSTTTDCSPLLFTLITNNNCYSTIDCQYQLPLSTVCWFVAMISSFDDCFIIFNHSKLLSIAITSITIHRPTAILRHFGPWGPRWLAEVDGWRAAGDWSGPLWFLVDRTRPCIQDCRCWSDSIFGERYAHFWRFTVHISTLVDWWTHGFGWSDVFFGRGPMLVNVLVNSGGHVASVASELIRGWTWTVPRWSLRFRRRKNPRCWNMLKVIIVVFANPLGWILVNLWTSIIFIDHVWFNTWPFAHETLLHALSFRLQQPLDREHFTRKLCPQNVSSHHLGTNAATDVDYSMQPHVVGYKPPTVVHESLYGRFSSHSESPKIDGLLHSLLY